MYIPVTCIVEPSLAMAEMQIVLAAIYRKYLYKNISMMTDAIMEVDDGIAIAGPVVSSLDILS